MKKLIITAFLIMSVVIAALPQSKSTVIDKTKFNGVWFFDTKASKADSETKKRYKGQDLTIIYIEPEFKIIDPRTRNGETRYATVVFLQTDVVR